MNCPYCNQQTKETKDSGMYYPYYKLCQQKDHKFIYYCWNDFKLVVDGYEVERISDLFYYTKPNESPITISYFNINDIVRTLKTYRNLSAFL